MIQFIKAKSAVNGPELFLKLCIWFKPCVCLFLFRVKKDNNNFFLEEKTDEIMGSNAEERSKFFEDDNTLQF